jgi:hypothetical protein
MSERATESGILLPDADRGTPVVVMQLDRPGLQVNITGPDDHDVVTWADAITGDQRNPSRGTYPRVLPAHPGMLPRTNGGTH